MTVPARERLDRELRDLLAAHRRRMETLPATGKAVLTYVDREVRFPDSIHRTQCNFEFVNPDTLLMCAIPPGRESLFYPLMDEMARRYNAVLEALEWLEEREYHGMEELVAILAGEEGGE